MLLHVEEVDIITPAQYNAIHHYSPFSKKYIPEAYKVKFWLRRSAHITQVLLLLRIMLFELNLLPKLTKTAVLASQKAACIYPAFG